jgi:hypothetical protein
MVIWCDMLAQEVDSATAAAYAEEIGATYLETSAKDDVNVHNIFIQLGECISVFTVLS